MKRVVLIASCFHAMTVLAQAQTVDPSKFGLNSKAQGQPASSSAAPATDLQALRLIDAGYSQLMLASPSASRGPREASIYESASLSTVLVVSSDGIGSGVLVSQSGHIVTNNHVIGKETAVKVVFRPISGSDVNDADIRPAKVLKVDEVADLALLQVTNIPAQARPIALHESNVQVGEDAHAIGHPRGQMWTYTKGYVSQLRTRFEWNKVHVADVIQTQTPINPGNSGGPLINDQGRLIGINSFKDEKSPGLNYAVAASEVKAFLQRSGSRVAPRPKVEKCGTDPVEVKRVNDKDDGPTIVSIFDIDCTGRRDFALFHPEDKTKASAAVFFSAKGNIRLIVFDHNRDGKWDESFIDDDDDGKFDRKGSHPDGKLFPSKLVALK